MYISIGFFDILNQGTLLGCWWLSDIMDNLLTFQELSNLDLNTDEIGETGEEEPAVYITNSIKLCI